MTDYQKPLPGREFRLYRVEGGVESFVCLAITSSLQRSNQIEKAMVQDCGNPDAPAVQRAVFVGSSWSLPISGRSDASRIGALRDDAASVTPINYRLRIAPADGDGAGYYDGNFLFESFEEAKSENGFVTFSSTLTSDGDVTFTAVP